MEEEIMVQAPASNRHEKLRGVCVCGVCSLEMFYVVLCVLLGLMGVVITGYELAGTGKDDNGWHSLYVATYIFVGSVVCFLQAIPSWRVQSFTPQLLNLIAVYSLGSSAGYVASALTSVGEPDADLSPLALPFYYSDAIISFTSFGVCTAILFIIHEFFLKPEMYPRKQPFRYFMFVMAVGIISGTCMALAVLTINSYVSSVFGVVNHFKRFDPITPTLISSKFMSFLHLLGSMAVGALLLRFWQLLFISKIVVGLVGALQILVAIVAFVANHFNESKDPIVGIIFLVMGASILLTIPLAEYCAPKKCEDEEVPYCQALSSVSASNIADKTAADGLIPREFSDLTNSDRIL